MRRQAEAATRSGMARRLGVLARNPWVLAGLAGLLGAAVLWIVVQPLAGVVNDTDAATTVLYFDRIVHGQHLEALTPTTPKPLLTLIYGVAWTVTGDWRTLTVLTVLAGGAVVAMAARLAARLGGIGAAAIVTIGILAWPDFALEVGRGNSFVWGLALWLLAGVLMTADRPRPWLAGFALLLAGLARTETIWLLAAAMACGAWVGIQAIRGADRAQLRTALPLLLGALALPLACLHDFLLTGRPLYWLGVPGAYTALAYPDLKSISPLEAVRKEIVYFEPAAALLLLALVGGVWLMLSRRRAMAVTLAFLAGGVLLTLVLLAWRAIYISVRYYEEADAAILLAAAVGAAALIGWSLERVPGRAAGCDRPRIFAPGLIAAVLAIGVVAVDVPLGTVDGQVAPSRQAYAALETAIPNLSSLLVGAEGKTTTVRGANYPVADMSSCRVFVPRPFVPVVSVETGVPVTALGDSYLGFRDGKYPLKPGQWVLHIAAVDGSGGVYAPFEHALPTVLEAADGQSLSIVPVMADPQRGLWLDRVDAAPAG